MKNVLIIDDDFASVELIKELLKELKVVISIAVNGESAIKLLVDHPFDIVILDIKLPDISGFIVISEIRKIYGDKIKVIAQTASIFNPKEVYLNAGFDDYISKPINNHEFINLIGRLLT